MPGRRIQNVAEGLLRAMERVPVLVLQSFVLKQALELMTVYLELLTGGIWTSMGIQTKEVVLPLWLEKVRRGLRRFHRFFTRNSKSDS